MIFLQFYEGDLRRREDSGYGERRFYHHEFYQVVQDNYTRWFQDRPEERPSDYTLFQAVSDILETLEMYRFIERIDNESITSQDRVHLPAGYASDRVVLYSALEGLRGYRPHTLTQSIAIKAYGLDGDQDPDARREVTAIGEATQE